MIESQFYRTEGPKLWAEVWRGGGAGGGQKKCYFSGTGEESQYLKVSTVVTP